MFTTNFVTLIFLTSRKSLQQVKIRPVGNIVNIDHFIESATYGFLIHELQNIVKRTSEFSKVLQLVNKKKLYKAISML